MFSYRNNFFLDNYGPFVSRITFLVLKLLFIRIKHENIMSGYLIKKYIWLIIKLV